MASNRSFLAHSTARQPFSFNSILFLLRVNSGTPKLGYGVYQTPPEDTRRCVRDAIEIGYRSIDTAQAYQNEEGVGAAISESGLPREEFFLTTKVWITNAGYEKAKVSIQESLEKLKTDYLDLLLIHQPFGDYYGTYRAMEELYQEGKLRAIGVSNFGPDRYLDIQHFAQVKPAVNQIETHVFQQQKTAKEYLEKYGCQIESWGPFAEGRNDMFTNPVLTKIGEKYGKSAAQTALRFLLQKDVVVIPKSVHKERMQQNFDIFDFSLTQEDITEIEALDSEESLFFSHYDPKTVEWFMSIV